VLRTNGSDSSVKRPGFVVQRDTLKLFRFQDNFDQLEPDPGTDYYV
jgi:hypothetical protein